MSDNMLTISVDHSPPSNYPNSPYDVSRRGWEVEYLDGKVIKEGQKEWKDIPKKNIYRLTLYYDGRQWDILNKKEYYQKKLASMVPGIPESFQIESRSIGYYDNDCKILYTVDEWTGKMKMEVKEI